MSKPSFTVTLDVEDLRNICAKYGEATATAALDKILSDLKFKMKKACNFDTCCVMPVPKVIAEG